MYRVRQEALSFVGLSRNFVGGDKRREHFRLSAPGRAEQGPKPHRHPAIPSFTCIGDGPLVEVDFHLSPRFIQENLS